MFIRMFVYAKDDQQAIEICDKYLYELISNLNERSILKNDKYWKIEGVFVIEITANWDNTLLKKKELINNMKFFPVKLTTYGESIEEILIVRDSEVQISNMKEIEMINIFFNE